MDPDKQTVTLDKAKTIDVAKFIVNEERLVHFIDSLVVEVEELQARIQDHAESIKTGLATIEELNAKNRLLTNDLINLARREAELKKTREKPSFYTYNSFSGNPDGINSINVGGALKIGRSLFSFQVDPFINEKMVYQIGVGVKLF